MITLIHGVMKSGKTATLIDYYKEIKHDKFVVKHIIDIRDNDRIASRNGQHITSDFIYNPKDPITYLIKKLEDSKAKHVFISEFQFFDFDMYLFVLTHALYYNFYIEGLLKDYKNKYFGYTYKLLDHADKIIECTTFCQKCKDKKAEISHRLVTQSDQILIGDSEYEPRCLECIN